MANREFVPPVRGKSEKLPVDKAQPATSGYMSNIRGTSSLSKRFIVSQRPGLDKWGAGNQIGAAEQPVVAICTVSTVA